MSIDLIHGDCLVEMKKIPDKSIDLVLTDPPYGVQKATWDTEIPPIDIWEIINNIMKNNTSIVVFGGLKFMPQVMETVGSVFDYQWLFSWYKPNAMQFGKTGFSKLDIALWYGKGATKAKKRKLDVIVEPIIPSKNNFGHPTPKPVKVMKHIIECLSEEGDTILDPFMGSGTTGVACKELGRNFIGIEIDKNYFEIAQKRIANTQEMML